MPLISVCIPAYNRAALLSALLDSILGQDYDDFDVIIAEDSSPERSEISIRAIEYEKRFGGKIQYFENETTLGYDGNLRRLLELASGEYVLFMGNDDLLAPGALNAVAHAVKERRDLGVVLRSYSSFNDNPDKPVQIFRYFAEDRFFPPGPDAVVTVFRRCVFISGMVFKRNSALAYGTEKFDGTLLYQQHLAGRILAKEPGLYLNRIICYHRLGGVPDFGSSVAEKARFVPKQQTPESSVHFMQGMLAIASSFDGPIGSDVSRRILRDIGNYSYPILSIQADRSFGVFASYIWHLSMLGFWRVPLFHVYAFGLLVFGRKGCDRLISYIKKTMGRAPMLGGVYAGKSRGTEGH